MDELKATLSRKVGPFPVGVWIIIITAGGGIGFLVRKPCAGDTEGGSSADVSGSAGLGGAQLPSDRRRGSGAPEVVQLPPVTVTETSEEID